MSRMIALIDCNNFFASCERLNDATLIGKPVVVLSGNDGCVIARSNEAKALGIPMGIPFFKIHDIVVQHNVEVCSGNIPYYAQVSRRIMRTIAKEELPQEVYSIDECFLRLPKTPVMYDWATDLRQRLFTEIGIPVSIGIAPSKTLAKATTYFAKHYKGYKGICILDSEEKRQRALSLLPLAEVWGIGRHNLAKLQQRGIDSVQALLTMPRQEVIHLLGQLGIRLRDELLGKELIPFNNSTLRKSISMSRSLAQEIESIDEIRDCLHTFLNSCCRKLRKERLEANEMGIYLASNRFKKNPYSTYQALELTIPSADPIELLPFLYTLLESLYAQGIRYKRLGLYMGKLSSPQSIYPLFDPVDHTARNRLLATLDALESRFGRDTVHLASYHPETLKRLAHVEHKREITPTLHTDLYEALPYTSPRFDTSLQ